MDNINVEVIDDSINVTVEGGIGPQGPAGTPGANGVGVPTGGTTDQVLKKASNTDYDTVWGTVNLLPAGNNTEVQFNDGGSFGADSHFYYNKTTDILHVHGISGDATDGLLIEAQGGTDIGILGAGNTANVTWYGNHNFNNETANTIAGFGASKTLQSLSTATYPSLTELSYVKGVTSGIQTQLNNKIENLSSFDTDDLTEGTTNLYSQWEVNTYTTDFLQPKTTSQGLVIGADLHSSVTSAFNGVSAVFNDNIVTPGGGGNYFLNAAYGVSIIPIGGAFVSARARGTASAPEQTLGGDYLGALAFSGFSGTAWVTGGSNHILPGLWTAAATDVVSNGLELNFWIGGLLSKMISFETDTNAIIFNESQLDSDVTFYWDNGTAMFIEGSSGNITVASPGTQTNAVANIDTTQTFTNKRVTPRVGTTTSSATPTINTDSYDVYGLTAQAADITSFTTNLSGTPTNGQKLWIYVVGTAARAITWGASFENGASTLPTTTVGTERLDVGFVWNAVSSKWRCVAAGSS